MQPNTWKNFPFPEISISGKYVFSGKRFTATKHSLEKGGKVYVYDISKNMNTCENGEITSPFTLYRG